VPAVRLERETPLSPGSNAVRADRSTIVRSRANWPSKVAARASMPAASIARGSGSAGNWCGRSCLSTHGATIRAKIAGRRNTSSSRPIGEAPAPNPSIPRAKVYPDGRVMTMRGPPRTSGSVSIAITRGAGKPMPPGVFWTTVISFTSAYWHWGDRGAGSTAPPKEARRDRA
jgi:hypothetical protein